MAKFLYSIHWPRNRPGGEHWCGLAIAMYSNRFCSYKPGPWTLDWTMPWTGLWTGLKTFGNENFCGLLNSLQVARERKEPGACGMIVHMQ